MRQHEKYAYGVTMFQVAIAVAAISVLTKRPALWFVGLAFGMAGGVFLVLGRDREVSSIERLVILTERRRVCCSLSPRTRGRGLG